MYKLLMRVISIVVFVLSIMWLFFEGGFEPIITAIGAIGGCASTFYKRKEKIEVENSDLLNKSIVHETSKENNLSEFEKDLLIAARESGEFIFMTLDQIPGGWIRAGSKDFLDENDPAFNAKFLESFERLVDQGYIKQDSSKFFRLTSSGFELARKL